MTPREQAALLLRHGWAGLVAPRMAEHEDARPIPAPAPSPRLPEQAQLALEASR